jgi:hypothetical protein
MSKVIPTILIALFLPVLALAQSDESTPKTLEIGDKEIVYAEAVTIDDGTLYYDKNTDEEGAVMVSSSHDTNGDNLIDAWFVYDENQNVTTEAYDQTGDEKPDLILAVDVNGDVTKVSGEMASEYEPVNTKMFSPESVSTLGQEEDLVGDVSDISIEPKQNNWIFFIILFVVAAGLYFFWKRQK